MIQLSIVQKKKKGRLPWQQDWFTAVEFSIGFVQIPRLTSKLSDRRIAKVDKLLVDVLDCLTIGVEQLNGQGSIVSPGQE